MHVTVIALVSALAVSSVVYAQQPPIGGSGLKAVVWMNLGDTRRALRHLGGIPVEQALGQRKEEFILDIGVIAGCEKAAEVSLHYFSTPQNGAQKLIEPLGKLIDPIKNAFLHVGQGAITEADVRTIYASLPRVIAGLEEIAKEVLKMP